VEKPAVTSGDVAGSDRRQQVRVIANGSVIVRGRDTVHGRLANISSGGMLVRRTEPTPRCASGEQVEAELHLDRSGATWLQFRGEIVRSDPAEFAISFLAVPLDFTAVVQDAVVTAFASAASPHVLLVDPDAPRRAPFAALLRRAGCQVAEAATPLDAIAHLGGSAIHSWVVAIASTVPSSIAGELQRFLIQSDAPVEVRMLRDDSPTSSLAWFTASRRSG
jgi:hypothetical protein